MEIIQERISNLQFFLNGTCKFNDVQSLSRWVNNLMEDQLKRVASGLKTIDEARKVITEILEAEHKYRLKIMFNES